MRKYGQGCGTAYALDVIGDRWALLVVRELLLGPKRFTDLRDGLPGIGPNVLSQRLKELEETGVVPAVNQVELHPYFPQTALRAFHAEHGIRTESWSPLARRSELLNEQLLQELAVVHDVTPTQLVLRWHVQLGSTPIPKSADPDRQRENADVFGFRLSDEQVEAISGLERGRLWDGDPDTHEEM